ncbi:hypothetical protein J7Q84_06645 [Bacillus sp. 165]|nr:hypothetical protein [Bacillus sp. 165]
MVISGIFVGAWKNGNQQRANFHSETKEHRDFRTRISLWSGLIGVLLLALSGVLYYF